MRKFLYGSITNKTLLSGFEKTGQQRCKVQYCLPFPRTLCERLPPQQPTAFSGMPSIASLVITLPCVELELALTNNYILLFMHKYNNLIN